MRYQHGDRVWVYRSIMSTRPFYSRATVRRQIVDDVHVLIDGDAVTVKIPVHLILPCLQPENSPPSELLADYPITLQRYAFTREDKL